MPWGYKSNYPRAPARSEGGSPADRQKRCLEDDNDSEHSYHQPHTPVYRALTLVPGTDPGLVHESTHGILTKPYEVISILQIWKLRLYQLSKVTKPINDGREVKDEVVVKNIK